MDNCSVGLSRFFVIPNVRVFHCGGGISVSTVVERQPNEF
jgi:hypothetical protein